MTVPGKMGWLVSGVVQTRISRWCGEYGEFILTCQHISNYHCLVFTEDLTVVAGSSHFSQIRKTTLPEYEVHQKHCPVPV